MSGDKFWDVYVYGYITGAGLVCFLCGICALVGLAAGLLATAHILPEAEKDPERGLQRLSGIILGAQQVGGVGMIIYSENGQVRGAFLGDSIFIFATICVAGLIIGFWPLTNAFLNRASKLAIRFCLLTFIIPGAFLFIAFLIASHFRPWVD